jgi:hypothetical protein
LLAMSVPVSFLNFYPLISGENKHSSKPSYYWCAHVSH